MFTSLVYRQERERGREMESDKKVEIIQKAIRKLMEEEEEADAETFSSPKSFSALHEDEDNEKPSGRQRQLLSKLLSELESMEEKVGNVTEEANVEDTEMDEKMNTSTKEIGNCSNEEILEEVRSIKRQNRVTHWLVSTMILLTLAWQLSEVSLILKIKDGLSNPLKSVGGLIGGYQRQVSNNVQDVIKQASEKQKQVIEPICLPGLKIPELPHLGLDNNTSDDNEDD